MASGTALLAAARAGGIASSSRYCSGVQLPPRRLAQRRIFQQNVRSRPALTTAHYRFAHPTKPGERLTGSRSKKVISQWQQEVALQQASHRTAAGATHRQKSFCIFPIILRNIFAEVVAGTELLALTRMPLLRAQLPLIRDEILLVLRDRPDGLPIDLLWPEIRQACSPP